MAGMTKQERAELKAVIKNRFKILRQDVDARRAELNAQLLETIKSKFEANDQAWNDALFLIGQAVDEANRVANDVMRKTYEGWPDKVDRQLVARTNQLEKPADDRRALYREHEAALNAQVQDAYAALLRQEGDLLERLVIGALESDEAREFLSSIPTVAQLVPASRLAELAASLKEIEG